MTSFRLKQIAFVLCLMASLLTASPAACVCSHHEETKAAESDCHSQHESTESPEATQAPEAVNVIDVDCISVVDRREPFAASKSVNKELKPFDAVSDPEQLVSVPKFASVETLTHSTPEFSSDLSYANTLRSLLPARAPPRL